LCNDGRWTQYELLQSGQKVTLTARISKKIDTMRRDRSID
jgi:hypothetical protein